MSSVDLLRLVGVVVFAVTCIVIGDTAGKTLTGNGFDPFFVAWSRFVLAAVVLLPFSGLSRKELPNLLSVPVLIRSVFIVGGISCILTALKTEPMANAFGAFFIGPVVAYVLAIIFLGEKPSRMRSALLALGFLGVMFVVKPGFGATIGMAYALGAGTFYGAYLVMTRTVAGLYRPRFLLMSQLLIGAVILSPLGMTATFPQINLVWAVLIAVSALGSAVGNFLLVIASRGAEASLIAPLIYSQLIVATLLGVLVFGDWPDGYTLLGLAMIVASGAGSLVANRSKVSLG